MCLCECVGVCAYMCTPVCECACMCPCVVCVSLSNTHYMSLFNLLVEKLSLLSIQLSPTCLYICGKTTADSPKPLLLLC